MSSDPLDEALVAHPLLGSLAAVARRRRAARELAEEEFADGRYADETEPEIEAARLAAADIDVVRFGDGEVELEWRDGAVSLLRGAGGLALRVEGVLRPLAAGAPVLLRGMAPAELVVVDARGRKRVLQRR